MARYDKDTIRAKFEWEGGDALTWFKPEEVPEELEDLWAEALTAHYDLEDLMDQIWVILNDE